MLWSFPDGAIAEFFGTPDDTIGLVSIYKFFRVDNFPENGGLASHDILGAVLNKAEYL